MARYGAVLTIALMFATGASAEKARSARGTLLVKSLAETALNLWADGDGVSEAGIEWDSQIGVAMLGLMRVLVSPMMHVAAEMTETLLPQGQLVRDTVVYAPAGIMLIDG